MKTTVTSTTDKIRRVLIRRYHTLCTRLGLEHEERLELLSSYGVESSLQLTTNELEDACTLLDQMLHQGQAEHDRWRKRVMASIGGWLRMLGQEQSAPRIRAIACRATSHANFNDIPLDRLRNIYYSFLNKQKDLTAIKRISDEEMDLLSYMN